MVRNKGGLSAIVATVLIVLITVAAVAIFWVAILPVIQENILFVGEEARLSIIVDKGYTAFDADKRIASVQVKRGSDDANLSRLNIIFEVDGSSVIFKTTSAPAVNEMKTYWINFTKEGILGDPSSVSVAPVYLRNGQEVLGEVGFAIDLWKEHTTPVEEPVVLCNIADVDGDGDVDWDDMNTGGCYADLNRDGIWDTADFILMKSNFGETTATLCRRLPLSGIGDCI